MFIITTLIILYLPPENINYPIFVLFCFDLGAKIISTIQSEHSKIWFWMICSYSWTTAEVSQEFLFQLQSFQPTFPLAFMSFFLDVSSCSSKKQFIFHLVKNMEPNWVRVYETL